MSTTLSNIFEPSNFLDMLVEEPYYRSNFAEGGMAFDAALSALVAGGGRTFDMPFYKELDPSAVNIGSDVYGNIATPSGVLTGTDVGVRLVRNYSLASPDILALLGAEDPLSAARERLGRYWANHLSLTGVGVLKGAAAAAEAAASSTYLNDISAASSAAGTQFSVDAAIDTLALLEENMDQSSVVVMHPKIYAQALKEGGAVTIANTQNPAMSAINTFLDRRVVISKDLPRAAAASSGFDYDTYFISSDFIRYGAAPHKNPVAFSRDESRADGDGVETISTRVNWCVHPKGFAWAGSASSVGGPDNGTGANELGAAASWNLVATDAKIRVLRTTEVK